MMEMRSRIQSHHRALGLLHVVRHDQNWIGLDRTVACSVPSSETKMVKIASLSISGVLQVF